MSLQRLARAAFRRIPTSAKSRVEFTRTRATGRDASSGTPTGTHTQVACGSFVVLIAKPGRETSGGLDGWKAGEQVRQHGRTLTGLLDADAAFVPAPGDTASWVDGEVWTVLSAAPLNGGQLRVAVAR